MSSEEYRKLESRSFSRDNADECLKALAREYRRLNGTKMKAEIIIVGGAFVVINYGFREMTTDINAIICASSDIVGILAEHSGNGESISMEQIRTAYTNLYGFWDTVPKHALQYLQRVYSNGNYAALYDVTVENEKRSRTELIQFQEDYPGVTSSENVNDILASLRTRKTQQDT